MVVEVGGGLRDYGGDVLDGYDVDEMCPSGRGQVLAPWPNRIAGGQYEFDGERLPAPADRAGRQRDPRPRALGELARGRARARRASSWQHVLHPQPGYPFTLRLRVEYALDDDGLAVRTIAENVGDARVPVRRRPPPVHRGADRRVDELFTATDRPQRRRRRSAWTAVARSQVGDVTVWADERWKYVQLFTGDEARRRAARFAVEPMTCPPNAFSTGEDLIRLEPGDAFEGRWGIAAV